MTDTITVVDLETTGMDPDDDIMELAQVILRRHGGVWHIAHQQSHLLSDCRPPCLEALATHHIRWEVAQARGVSWAAAVRGTPLETGPGSGMVVAAAHNWAFDRAFLERADPCLAALPGLCTWRCAMRLFPESPSHSNQVLRYYLDLDVEPEGVPHRALYDAQVTAALLLRMLEMHTAAGLIWVTQRPLLLHTVRFGKHRGERWADVPRRYLQWVLEQDFDADVCHTAQHHLSRLDQR